ncbi:UDP-N-acetylglucosamine--N-acetylmuramyl-(pentapeptide) pyrophosphoryl-undecaprenol N-acetylglucosamine transferase [Nitratifractor sp.]
MGSIVMTGGGTGGHLAIVRAVKEALDEAPVYIGSTGGQDRQWFGEDAGFVARYFLETRGVVNQGFAGKIRSLGLLGKAVLRARRLLREHQASVVFSVGGYSAAPAAMAAILSGIPLVIHEQNAVSGSLNRLLRPFARAFLSSYDEESSVKAYPVKSIFFEKARVRHMPRTILFLGGSQGAVAINNLALELAPALKARNISILHQAGERNIDAVRRAYEAMGIDAEVFGFSDRIPELMERADFAVARAGASTLWELAANGLPTLFVPYPYAAGDHQYHNAAFLAERNLAWVLREAELEPGRVLDLMKQDLSIPSRGLIDFTPRNGAEEIAKLLKTLAV